MGQHCQNCGSPVGAEQAFCPKCGAVIGINPGKTQDDGGWDLASTLVGQPRPTAPQRPSAERRAHPTRPEAAPPPTAPTAPRKGSSVLLAVVGFVAVLLIGGLLILLLYLNSQG